MGMDGELTDQALSGESVLANIYKTMRMLLITAYHKHSTRVALTVASYKLNGVRIFNALCGRWVLWMVRSSSSWFCNSLRSLAAFCSDNHFLSV